MSVIVINQLVLILTGCFSLENLILNFEITYAVQFSFS